MRTKTVTLGVYINDYQSAEERGFKQLAQMVSTGGTPHTFSEEPIIYKAVRLPINIIEKLTKRSYEVDKTIVNYTAGCFRTLLKRELEYLPEDM